MKVKGAASKRPGIAAELMQIMMLFPVRLVVLSGQDSSRAILCSAAACMSWIRNQI
jgi:hypothetical protein